MKAHWLFLILAPVLAGCPLTDYLTPIEVEYTSKGVCSGVELTASSPEIEGINYIYAKEGRFNRVPLTPGQPARIPDPNPPNSEPRRTYYAIYFLSPVPTSVDIGLTWRCLPDKAPLSVQFTHGIHGFKILRITERADSTYGFDIEIANF